MSARAVAIEFAKMRRLRVGLIASVWILAVVASSLLSAVASPLFDPGDGAAWNAVLAGMSLGVPLASPLLLAVLASRQVDMENESGGWILQASAGLAAGAVCRAKVAALSLIVTGATVIESVLVVVAGRWLAGITAPVPLGQWTGFTLCVLAVNLAVLAIHVGISVRFENQLVALGIGVLGTMLAVFSQGLPASLAHVTPWGYYALSRAADYRGDEVVLLPLSYGSVIALVGVVTVLFLVATMRLDRRDA